MFIDGGSKKKKGKGKKSFSISTNVLLKYKIRSTHTTQSTKASCSFYFPTWIFVCFTTKFPNFQVLLDQIHKDKVCIKYISTFFLFYFTFSCLSRRLRISVNNQTHKIFSEKKSALYSRRVFPIFLAQCCNETARE